MKKTRNFIFCMIFCIVTVFSSFSTLRADAVTFDISFETYSKALLLVSLDTNQTVYQKNADEKMYPASLTKIMTYIVAYENTKDVATEKVTVSQSVADELSGTGSSMSGVIVGEELTVLQLLNLMMVPSGNDAALVLAKHVGGTEEKFAELMNQKAAELGCTGTHFVNAHGLHDAQHYTTANDLYKITKYALSLPYFAEITDQVTYVLPATNKSAESRMVYTTNRLINKNANDGAYYYQYAKGVKTGTTDESGYCLVSTAVKDGYSYLCVALGSPSVDEHGETVSEHGEAIDTKKLYQWAFENLELKTILKTGESLGEVAVKFAWDKDSVLVTAAESYTVLLPSTVEKSSIFFDTELPEEIEAPVKKGDILGKVTLSYAGQTLTSTDLVAMESVEKSELLKTLDVSRDVLSSNWFTAIVCIVLFLLAAYIVLAILYNRKKKRLRGTRKYNDRRR